MKILISTDIGSDIDDALALLIMLNHPGIDLAGIYTVNGNVEVRSFIAKRMVDLAGAAVPVGCGVSKPLENVIQPYSNFEHWLVDDLFIDEEKAEENPSSETSFVDPGSVGIIVNGLEHMAQQLAQSEHVVFSLGPMTNIALLLRHYPKLIRNIKRLLIMGFRRDGGLEHNVRFDPIAAKEVLNYGIPITIIPGDVCGGYRMPVEMAGQMTSIAGQYVMSMFRAFIGGKTVSNYRADRELPEFLKNTWMPPEIIRGLGEEYQQIEGFKRRILVNIDEGAAYVDRNIFLDDLEKLARQLENPKYNYKAGIILARKLRELVPRRVSVADTYVPYCFLYPERVKTERMPESKNHKNATSLEVITEIEVEHFQGYLRQYLR